MSGGSSFYRVDPIAAATLHFFKERMSEWMAADIWDLPPELVLIVRRYVAGVGIVHAHFPFGLGANLWVDRPVWKVLAVIAEAVQQIGHPIDLPGDAEVVGVAMLSEGWALRAPDPAAAAVAKAWADEHSISNHPDRVEMKMIMAVDTAGFRYLVEHARGEAEALSQVDTGLGVRDARLDGRLYDRLSQILDAAVAHAA